jgi:hypothetical protein
MFSNSLTYCCCLVKHSFIYIASKDMASPLDIQHQGNFSALDCTVILLRLSTTPFVTNEAVCNVKSRSGPSVYVFSEPESLFEGRDDLLN